MKLNIVRNKPETFLSSCKAGDTVTLEDGSLVILCEPMWQLKKSSLIQKLTENGQYILVAEIRTGRVRVERRDSACTPADVTGEATVLNVSRKYLREMPFGSFFADGQFGIRGSVGLVAEPTGCLLNSQTIKKFLARDIYLVVNLENGHLLPLDNTYVKPVGFKCEVHPL